ncbi:hypothetical protein GWK47_049614 [Chionoecetes opilio]|uniref:Uncharacterized protein n=1 Tax=Chionoecetes opilio TaxID=41210 RepID=A0A8J5CF10_CHIOP|nr:hypothetical protein GWK47_049614 [Chionoecetes opilio]
MLLFSRRFGMKTVATIAVLAVAVSFVAAQIPENIQLGLNAGTDESDRRLKEVLADENITGFVNCMIKPWGETCGERAPIMAIMIKFALRDNLRCDGCSDRVKQQMKFIETRLRSNKPECTRLLDGIQFKTYTKQVCQV